MLRCIHLVQNLVLDRITYTGKAKKLIEGAGMYKFSLRKTQQAEVYSLPVYLFVCLLKEGIIHSTYTRNDKTLTKIIDTFHTILSNPHRTLDQSKKRIRERERVITDILGDGQAGRVSKELV